jgi:hydroxyacylglutathione hydrolase
LDGLFTVVEPFGVVIMGDYLSDFELPFIYHSAKAYNLTLQTVQHIFDHHTIQLLVPGHGLASTDIVEMKRRLDMASNYLHRLIQAVLAKDERAIAALGDEHSYKSPFTDECHKENVRIIDNEFNSH